VANVNLDAIDDREVRNLVAEYAKYADHDTIRQPGKFEAEPLYVVFYWGHMLQGDGETSYLPCEEHEDGDCECDPEVDYDQFDIQAGDAEAFPELEPSIGKYLRIREDSQGYVTAWIAAS